MHFLVASSALVRRRHVQAAEAFPLWAVQDIRAQLPETCRAVEAGAPLALALTRELGVERWVWTRLRQLPADSLTSSHSKAISIQAIARLFEAFGHNAPMPPADALSALLIATIDVGSVPPNRLALVLADALGRDARRSGWQHVLPLTYYQKDRSDLAQMSGPMCMFAYVLKDLLISANEDRLEGWSDLDKSSLVPQSIRALFKAASVDRIMRHAKVWDLDHRAAWKHLDCQPGEPLQLNGARFHRGPVTMEPLVSLSSLQREGREMRNCVASYWPMVSAGRCLVYSACSKRFNERATAVYLPSTGLHPWRVECEGPGNTAPTPRMRAISNSLGKSLCEQMALQSASIRKIHLETARALERFRPGGSIYTRVGEISAWERSIVRRWFPCPNGNPIDALRVAWNTATGDQRKPLHAP